MKTKEILECINSNGGFDNFCHWNEKDVAVWVRYTFHCSRYVAKNVARELV